VAGSFHSKSSKVERFDTGSNSDSMLRVSKTEKHADLFVETNAIAAASKTMKIEEEIKESKSVTPVGTTLRHGGGSLFVKKQVESFQPHHKFMHTEIEVSDDEDSNDVE
jgi:hypothetical protein